MSLSRKRDAMEVPALKYVYDFELECRRQKLGGGDKRKGRKGGGDNRDPYLVSLAMFFSRNVVVPSMCSSVYGSWHDSRDRPVSYASFTPPFLLSLSLSRTCTHDERRRTNDQRSGSVIRVTILYPAIRIDVRYLLSVLFRLLFSIFAVGRNFFPDFI